MQGVPAVPTVSAIEGSVDLAVLAVPAADVLPALSACAAKGVAGAIVISAGFREAGPAGEAREADLRAWLRGQPLRVLGPNCLGWIRPSRRLNATFAPGMPEPGGIAFVSHSGALATAILDWARERHLGFSLFASLGNQADVTESDVLEAAAEDPETRVIALYLEGVADGHRFRAALRRAAAQKPVVVLKAGRSPEGARAVASHTGALAGSDAALDAAVREAGAVRVRTVEELFDLARGAARQPLPGGRRLLVVTNGGGLGVVATDAAREAGLEVPALDPRCGPAWGRPAARRGPRQSDRPDWRRGRRPVRERAPRRRPRPRRRCRPRPHDRAGGHRRRRDRASDPRSHPGLDAAGRRARWWAAAGSRRASGSSRRPASPATRFPSPRSPRWQGLARLAEGARNRAVPTPASPGPPAAAAAHVAALRSAGLARLGLLDLAPILTAYGIPLVLPQAAADPAEAAAVAARLGGPVALKIRSPDISHKTDVGGVVLGLVTPEAVGAAARAMLARVHDRRPGAAVHGFLVQPMAPPGRELLVGAVRDPQFGPLVMVGFGGVYVEVLRDTATRLAPVSTEEALRMLDELRMAPLLRGVRGEPPVDRMALAGALSRLARIAEDLPDLAEIELNPLVAGPDGVVAVDARARLERPGGAAGSPAP